MDVTAPSPKPSFAGVIVAAAGWTAAMLAAWLCVTVNLERACVIQDSPYLGLCPAREPEAQVQALRSRIAANPGDANAYIELALGLGGEDGSTEAATRLAPNHVNVLLLRASRALERQAWSEAAPLLVQLVQVHDESRATSALARLIAGGQGQLLAPLLVPGSQWLPRVLPRMPNGTTSTALPLMAQALKLGVLTRDAGRAYIRNLKAAGAWVDAYSLWLALRGNKLPALYNASFDEPFISDGFDWEINAAGSPSRAGAIAERKGAAERGAVLDVRFTGRAIAVPMVRQYLFLGPGRYKLSGEYASQQLRIEQGLAWNVRCTAAPQARAGVSQPLNDSGGAWRRFDFDFVVPPSCGEVVSLQLETYAPVDAALGARGRVAFDAFALEKIVQ